MMNNVIGTIIQCNSRNDNSKINQDGEEACGKTALCQPMVNKEDVRSFGTSSPGGGASCPPLSQDEPLGQARTTEEQPKSDYAQSGRCVTLGMVKTVPRGSDFDRAYRSWSINQSPDAPLSKSSSMPQLEIFPLKSPPLPPRKSECAPVKRPNQGRNGVRSAKRTRLLVFIKIILKCLICEDPCLHLEAKQIITECTRKNREGIPGYDPLADVIIRQLRIVVGEVHWNRAESLMSHYLKTRSRNNLKIDRPTYAASV
mmetsp:Transcript_41451/g.67982  ORF Transcript_41451/g.67982 Transcript_41451/m.67982 type:complete len:257 (+) Transcript_41451:76-846(+)